MYSITKLQTKSILLLGSIVPKHGKTSAAYPMITITYIPTLDHLSTTKHLNHYIVVTLNNVDDDPILEICNVEHLKDLYKDMVFTDNNTIEDIISNYL